MHTPVAVILVAGIGERLRPLTDDRPKALVDVGGETMLGRSVRLLVEHGVDEIVLATGYRDDAVREAMRGCRVSVVYCRNDAFDRTQNSVSLALCREAVGDRAFFKLDGDLLYRREVLERLAASTAPLAAAIDRRNAFGKGLGKEEMKATADASGRLLAFGKHLDPKVSYGESIGIERVSGVAVRSLFHALDDAIASGEKGLYYEDVYARLLEKGLEGAAIDVSDLPWTEVDTPDDLTRARELVRSGVLD